MEDITVHIFTLYLKHRKYNFSRFKYVKLTQLEINLHLLIID